MSDIFPTLNGGDSSERTLSAQWHSHGDAHRCEVSGEAGQRRFSMAANRRANAYDRRRFLAVAAGALSVGGVAPGQTARAQDAQMGVTQPEGPGAFAALKRIDAGVLDVGYAEAGPIDGPTAILLHGWPYDIHSFADAAPRLASAGFRVIVPFARGYGATRFLSNETPRTAQPSALAVDTIALMDALNIKQATIAGFDWGARTADIVAALWPDRVKGIVSVSGYLIGSQEAGKAPLPPGAELQWWYQFYFATERGREGYSKYRRDFARLIWRIASPKWQFDDATFSRSAAAFENPDHVDIVIHNYRWRLGLAPGDPSLDGLEAKLAMAPQINVPTITLEGDENGAPHADQASYAKRFSGAYLHRLVRGGVGHNLPQEAPEAFSQAVIDVSRG
jgi:pimeloyl-ACP methyl ester carboxylesterase